MPSFTPGQASGQLSCRLTDQLATALQARAPLMARLGEEQTDAYRLFHGTVEGRPGLTVDRYGSLILTQSFHGPLSQADEEAELEAFYLEALPDTDHVYNDRSHANSRVSNPLPPERLARAEALREFSELGVKYNVQARHGGQDPWLFLDLRAGRRRIMAEAPEKSVLNVFAYTCGVVWRRPMAGARMW
jgi:23S rRNA (cytosine1962-C5)-methyltransferase